MASWSEMSGGARAGLVALGVAGVAVVGTLIWRANQPVPVPPEAVVATSEPVADTAATSAASAPVAEPSVVAPKAVEPIAPSFDNWRVEADGSAVVSGRAEPGSMVSVLIDGRPVAEARASGSGAFALLFTLAPNDKPSVMMLESLLADGRQIFSVETIALAPIPGPAPADVASAAPAAPPAAVVVTEDTVTVIQPPAEEVAAAEAVQASPVEEPEGVADPVAPAPEVTAATPAPVVAVVVDAISYNAAGDVLLSGKGQADQFVRVYLDNVLAATGPITSSGAWQITLVDTPPGLYTLRADQIDIEGKVTARFETPFQRETREALAALAQGTAAPAQAPAQPESAPAPAAEPTPDPAPAPAQTETTPEVVATAVPETASVAIEAAPEPQTPAPTAEAKALTAEQGASTGASSDSQQGTEATAQAEAAAQTEAAVRAEATAQAEATEQTEAPEQTEETVARVVAEPAAPEQPALAPPEPQPTAATVAEAAPDARSTPGAAAPPEPSDTAPGPVPATVSITVQPGYTLWGIARASLGDGILYVQVYNANKDKIKNPDLIYPGQVFTLPVE